MGFDILHTALSLLIRVGTTWYVNPEVGRGGGWLKAEAGEADLLFPPAKGWIYGDGSDWLPDPSLECSREPSTPCKEIRVELGGKDSASSGVYLPVDGEYRDGRQVDFTCFHHTY